MFFCVRLEAENKTRKMFVNILLKKKRKFSKGKVFVIYCLILKAYCRLRLVLLPGQTSFEIFER